MHDGVMGGQAPTSLHGDLKTWPRTATEVARVSVLRHMRNRASCTVSCHLTGWIAVSPHTPADLSIWLHVWRFQV